MAEASLLGEDGGVEPLEGEIAEMATVEARHAASVRALARRLQQQFRDRVIVSVQNPIHRSPDSEARPDLALLAPRDDPCREKLPAARHVPLVAAVVHLLPPQSSRVAPRAGSRA